jgi:hypothetical protein
MDMKCNGAKKKIKAKNDIEVGSSKWGISAMSKHEVEHIPGVKGGGKSKSQNGRY